MTEELITEHVKAALIVRPGDTLVIATDGHLTMTEMAAVRDGIKERLGIADVLVIDGATHLGVYRPDQLAVIA